MLHALASLLIYTVVAVFGTSGNHAIASKNRVWNFFSSPSVFVGKNKSQVLESQQEKTLHTEKTASGMPEYRARYYDPVMGRFLSEDPIGFGGGDSNLNRYVLNSPYGYRDPSGNILEYVGITFQSKKLAGRIGVISFEAISKLLDLITKVGYFSVISITDNRQTCQNGVFSFYLTTAYPIVGVTSLMNLKSAISSGDVWSAGVAAYQFVKAQKSAFDDMIKAMADCEKKKG